MSDEVSPPPVNEVIKPEFRNAVEALLVRAKLAYEKAGRKSPSIDPGEVETLPDVAPPPNANIFLADLAGLRDEIDSIGTGIPNTYFELGVWLSSPKNQDLFLRWLGLGVQITEKNSEGMDMAKNKVPGFSFRDYGCWPIDNVVRILNELERIDFDVLPHIKMHLESNGAPISDRLLRRYVPTLSSSNSQIRKIAQESYKSKYLGKNYAGLDGRIKDNSGHNLKALLSEYDSARGALGAYMAITCSSLFTFERRQIANLGDFYPDNLEDLNKICSAILSASSRGLIGAKDILRQLVIMAYIETHLLGENHELNEAEDGTHAEVAEVLG